MKYRRRQEHFSVSFLDVISCGFGAIVLLVLLSKEDVENSGPSVSVIMEQMNTLSANQTTYHETLRQVTDLRVQAEDLDQVNDMNEAILSQSSRDIANRMQELSALKEQVSHLESRLQQARQHQREPPPAPEIPNVGGIPVDRKYVIFIIDTSGSMKLIWDKVLDQVEDILEIHPTVEGFQIMNDNGNYLVTAYQGRWIPDTPSRRKSILQAMKQWNSHSRSNPVPGIVTALRSYARDRRDTSIYVLGDEFLDSSYDQSVKEIRRRNADAITQQPLARIHGIAFYNRRSSANDQFSILMREVARLNDGAFVAIR